MSNTYGYVGNPATQGGSSGNRGIFETKDVIHQKKIRNLEIYSSRC